MSIERYKNKYNKKNRNPKIILIAKEEKKEKGGHIYVFLFFLHKMTLFKSCHSTEILEIGISTIDSKQNWEDLNKTIQKFIWKIKYAILILLSF